MPAHRCCCCCCCCCCWMQMLLGHARPRPPSLQCATRVRATLAETTPRSAPAKAPPPAGSLHTERQWTQTVIVDGEVRTRGRSERQRQKRDTPSKEVCFLKTKRKGGRTTVFGGEPAGGGGGVVGEGGCGMRRVLRGHVRQRERERRRRDHPRGSMSCRARASRLIFPPRLRARG